MTLNLLPDNAPFTPGQRAWLNGFFAGLLSVEQINPGTAPAEKVEELPWHDPNLALDERMKLADGRKYELRLMAAMGQMDCGQCGYMCKTYAEAIAGGDEKDLTLCVPGGKPTVRKLKDLMAETPAPVARKPVTPAAVVNVYTRKIPFAAKLKDMARLTLEGSVKDVRHVIIDLAGSGITYEPGDSLGFFPRNCPRLVEDILRALGAAGDEHVATPRGESSVRQAMLEWLDITKPGDETLECLAASATDADEKTRLKRWASGDEDIEGWDLLDILHTCPAARPSIGEFVSRLGQLQPRLFSIASSPRVHPDEVHLTVGVVRYELNERQHKGVASCFIADRLQRNDQVPIYIQPNYGFRLPLDGDRPVIMIGPGTGVAPFRAFLEERKVRGARGKNWLFFGNPHSATDFFYRDELRGFLHDGILTRLDTAFSRDQRDKIYVQQLMLQHSQEFWSWLQEGAVLYVCGDATRMARDVHEMLHRIAVQRGMLSEGAAVDYVKQLAAESRYLRDVY
ncbi:MAG: sulfite reductase subunit alpha [Gammaproteobacteria bacterium]|nr:sulfite reductase subunit alpha [Gammaproteobacteria bacterium]